MATQINTQIDIRHVLSAKYGPEADFPSWTTPFIRAVGLLKELDDQDIPEEQPSETLRGSTDREGALAEPSTAEMEMERMEKEVVANLESVSICDILFR